MLYYKIGNVPNTKPDRLRLSDGSTITNPTHEQLLANGWIVAPSIPSYEYPNVLEWLEPDWLVRPPNSAELEARWEQTKKQATDLLAASDYKVLKAYEAQTPVDSAIIDYRQALRDIYNNVNNINPFDVIWPEKPY